MSGVGQALVTATGARTQFGAIAHALVEKAPQTEYERGVRSFGLVIMRTVFGLVLFVFLVSALLHHDTLESLLFALALAVGLTPEFLPMIMTVTLAAGAQRMAHGKVIVKHLSAIENLGTMDVLCSDKTGTLTLGTLTHAVSRGCPRRAVGGRAALGLRQQRPGERRAQSAGRGHPGARPSGHRQRTRSAPSCRSTSNGAGSACWPAAPKACRC